MNTNIKQRKADMRYKVMSKRPRKDPAKYYLIGLVAALLAGSLQMAGTPEEIFIGAVMVFIAFWAGSIGYWEDWYAKETYKRNLESELRNS